MQRRAWRCPRLWWQPLSSPSAPREASRSRSLYGALSGLSRRYKSVVGASLTLARGASSRQSTSRSLYTFCGPNFGGSRHVLRRTLVVLKDLIGHRKANEVVEETIYPLKSFELRSARAVCFTSSSVADSLLLITTVSYEMN